MKQYEPSISFNFRLLYYRSSVFTKEKYCHDVFNKKKRMYKKQNKTKQQQKKQVEQSKLFKHIRKTVCYLVFIELLYTSRGLKPLLNWITN